MVAAQHKVTVRADDQQRRGGDLPGDELQQPQGRRIGPVEVIKDQYQRLASRRRREKGGQAVEKAKPRLLRLHPGRGGQLRESLRTSGMTWAISAAPAPISARSVSASHPAT